MKSIPLAIDGQPLTPRSISRDAPPGKAVVFCGDAEWGNAGRALELDVSSGKVTPLFTPGGRTTFVALAKDWAAWSDGSFGGVSKLSELKKAPKKGGEPMKGQPLMEERSPWAIGTARTVNGGANFAATDPGRGKTAVLSPDWKKVVWQADGLLTAVHPTKPILFVTALSAERQFDSDSWTLHALNAQSGRQVWKLVVKLPFRARLDYWSLVQTRSLEVRDAKGSEELIFSLAADAFDRGLPKKWYRVPLPRTEGTAVSVTNEPPTEVAVGETFEWAPTLKAGAASFVLKTAPDGMTVDAKTGKLTWKPDEAAIGKHDVELICKVGADEVPIVFELRVKPGRGESTPAPKKPEKGEDEDEKPAEKSEKKPEKKPAKPADADAEDEKRRR